MNSYLGKLKHQVEMGCGCLRVAFLSLVFASTSVSFRQDMPIRKKKKHQAGTVICPTGNTTTWIEFYELMMALRKSPVQPLTSAKPLMCGQVGPRFLDRRVFDPKFSAESSYA